MPLQIFPMPLQSTAAIIVVVDGKACVSIMLAAAKERALLLLDALKNFFVSGGEEKMGCVAFSWGIL